MGIANSSVSSSSATILSSATPTSVTNTIFLSTAPISSVKGVHTAEVLSTWDFDPPAERSSTTVVIPTEFERTELQNSIISRRDEVEAGDQRGSAPTQYKSRPISLTKRDRLKDKPNNESPAIQSASQHLKGVTPPRISLTGRRHVKEIPHIGLGHHDIYHTINVNPPQYVEEDTSHSTLQITGKYHLESSPPPVSSTQQASLETSTRFLDDVANSDEYTTPLNDDVDIPPELDSTELKRRSVLSEEYLGEDSSKENTPIKDAASTSSEPIPPTASEQKSVHHHRAHRNSAVALDYPTHPKSNSAVPQHRYSTSARTKRDLAPAQQVLTSEQPDFPSPQHPLTTQDKVPNQHKRQKYPQEQEPASWTVTHPPRKETERARWTVSNPPPREREGGTYSFQNLPARNGRERMKLSHYPTRKIQLFGRRRKGGNSNGNGSEKAGWKEAN